MHINLFFLTKYENLVLSESCIAVENIQIAKYRHVFSNLTALLQSVICIVVYKVHIDDLLETMTAQLFLGYEYCLKHSKAK